MKNSNRFIYSASALVALLAAGGCAHFDPTQAASTGTAQHAPKVHATLPIVFSNEDIETRMAKLELLATFREFWQAHVDRDWARRYAMELGLGGVTKDFYASYYDKAWRLKGLEIQTLNLGEVEGQPAAVMQITLTLQEPDKGASITVNRAERWRQTQEGWRHMLDDPLLTGNFSVANPSLHGKPAERAVAHEQQSGASAQ